MTNSNIKLHHVGIPATVILTIAVALLTQAEHDLPFVSTYLVTTAIPNAMTIIGVIQEVFVSKNPTMSNVNDVATAIQQIKTGFTALEANLKK